MNRATNVYVIGTGERGEGVEPAAATRSLAAARRWVLKTYGVEVWAGEPDAGPDEWIGYLSGSTVDQVRVKRVRLVVPA